MADQQDLITNLLIKDNLSVGLANAKSSLGAFDAQANKTIGGVDKLGLSLTGLVKGFVALQTLREVTGFFSDAAAGAIAEEAGIARLGTTLRANVSDWNGNTDAIEKTILAHSRLGFIDDEVRDSFGLLVAATHDVNRAFEIQNTAMDLARFKGISLAEASEALIRVEAGSFRILKSLGIELANGATQTEALAAVQKVAGGQAEEFGNKTAGASAKAAVAIDHLKDVVGTAFLKPAADGANALADGIENNLLPKLELAGLGLDRLAKAAGGSGGGTSGEFFKLGDVVQALGQRLGLVNPIFDKYGQEALDSAHATAEAAAEAGDYERQLRFQLLTQQNANAAAGETIEIHKTLAQSLIVTESKMLGATGGADDLSDSLLRTANAATIAARDLDTAGTAAERAFAVFRTSPNKTGDITGFGANFDSGGDADALAGRRRAQADVQAEMDRRSAEALQRSKDAASVYADVLANKLDAALSKEKRLTDTLFDALHQRHLQAIADTEKLAEAQHSTALQAISDALKLKLEANAAPVNAAEAAQRRIELQRQRRGLNEGLQAALQSGDPTAIRNAQEALQSFNADQRIAALKLTQSKLDLAAQTEAAAANKLADDKLAAAKTAQADAIEAETKRAKKQRDDFDRALAALKVRDKGASPDKVAKDIDALNAKFGITTDAQGFRHIADVLTIAIKSIKVPSVQLTNVVNFTSPAIILNGRIVAAALASSQSFTATPGVRTGALSPRP